MPTVLPTTVATLFSNTGLLIAAFGVGTLALVYSITGFKFARGLS